MAAAEIMREVVVPPRHGSGSDGDERMPSECRAHIWRCLSLDEQLSCSAVSATGRRAAPVVLRLAAIVWRLYTAIVRNELSTRELSSLVEFVATEQKQLVEQFPAVLNLLYSFIRHTKALIAIGQCAVESLAQVLGSTRRLSEVFAQYDCDVARPDVFEPALEALASAVASDVPLLRRTALDSLVGITRSINLGIRESGASTGVGGPWAAAWAERERRREEAKANAGAFNRDPEGWWRQRREARIETDALSTTAALPSSSTSAPSLGPEAPAAASTPSPAATEAAREILELGAQLERGKVGELLCKHKELMLAYMHHCDLRTTALVPSFRRVLRGLSLPGEAQHIDVFCECLGSVWGRANGVDPDAAHIFAFSLVMLSTDLHSARNPGHEAMTYEQFARNLSSALTEGHITERMMRRSYEQVRDGALLEPRSRPGKSGDHGDQTRFAKARARGLRMVRDGALSESRSRRPSTESGEYMEQARLAKACVRLRNALLDPLREGGGVLSPRSEDPGVGSAALLWSGGVDGAPPPHLADLWRALWSAAWAPLLGGFSAGAHAAGADEELLMLALRGLQLGCEVSALLSEADQAQAFSMALQQLASK
mmetsp:Transcript_22340/g.64006  ORF Transcript_22340/g.64006 Transcript_22340/m.64006 type:complete len:602 (+) Transcript_22340:127-1932(+)